MKLADLDVDEIYSYYDYFQWKFEERVELIKGKIFKMSPAANYYHQLLAGRLHREISNFLHKKPCKVFFAPFDVRFPRKSNDDKEIYTVLQPDLCIICDPSKLDKRGCIGAPDIVIEILSPSNNTRDLKYKYDIYEESGVKEYWVVFPEERTMLVYTLTSGIYIASRFKMKEDIITTPVLPGFIMQLADIFQEED